MDIFSKNVAGKLTTQLQFETLKKSTLLSQTTIEQIFGLFNNPNLKPRKKKQPELKSYSSYLLTLFPSFSSLYISYIFLLKFGISLFIISIYKLYFAVKFGRIKRCIITYHLTSRATSTPSIVLSEPVQAATLANVILIEDCKPISLCCNANTFIQSSQLEQLPEWELRWIISKFMIFWRIPLPHISCPIHRYCAPRWHQDFFFHYDIWWIKQRPERFSEWTIEHEGRIVTNSL